MTLEAPPPDDAPTRAGFVAILGAPNVGKSTLLNRLVGSKVSIVSHKAQTTRRRIVGISMVGATQVLFVDTPGIFSPKRRLDRAMVDAAWRAASDADVALFVVDAVRGLDANARLVLNGLPGRAVLVLNKIDLVARPKLLPLIQDANAVRPFEATYLIAAETGDGCDDLLAAAAAMLPEGPWLYPEDEVSDLSGRALAAEITREKVFRLLHQELPYSITVETEAWAEAPDGKEIRIDQTVYVERASQKSIVLGKGGAMIRQIGETARKELETLLDARVHLFLFVKVRDWTDDPERYGAMGLDFN